MLLFNQHDYMLDKMPMVIWLLLRNDLFQFSLQVNWSLKNMCHLNSARGYGTSVMWPPSAGRSLDWEDDTDIPTPEEWGREGGWDGGLLECARSDAMATRSGPKCGSYYSWWEDQGILDSPRHRWGACNQREASLLPKPGSCYLAKPSLIYVPSCVRNSLKIMRLL